MQFQSFERDGSYVHVSNTKQFKTRHISLKLSYPLSRESVTHTAILPYVWMEGTQTYPSAEEILRYTDELYGTSLRTWIGKRGDRQILEVYAAVPDESGLDEAAKGLFERVSALVFDVASRPAADGAMFPKRHVERERTLHQHRIESLFDDKIAYAADRCLAEACADDTAGLPRLGFVEDLEGISPQVLWAQHEAVLRLADVHLYVVGNVGDEQEVARSLQDVVSQRFSRGRTQRTSSFVTPILATRQKQTKYVTEELDIAQAKLDFAYKTGVSVASDDYPAMLMMNGILGGTMQSKLFQNVREKASLAYYCSSRFDSLTGVILVQMGIELANHERAENIVFQQVQDVLNGVISDDEMAFTASAIRNQYTQLADSPMSVADVHFNGTLAGRRDSVDELLRKVANVSREDVVRVAQNLQLDTVYLLAQKEGTNE